MTRVRRHGEEREASIKTDRQRKKSPMEEWRSTREDQRRHEAGPRGMLTTRVDHHLGKHATTCDDVQRVLGGMMVGGWCGCRRDNGESMR